MPDELVIILDRIVNGQSTPTDIARLRELLGSGDREEVKAQFAKFNVNIGEGKDIHIGDQIYQGADVEKIQEMLIEILDKQDRDPPPSKTQQQYRAEKKNRQGLLDIVYRYWVDGCLEESLHHDIQIKQRLEKWQDVVELPWGNLGSPRQVLPLGIRIIDQFKGRLLILGQAGAGKTIALLELAKDLIEQAKEDSTLPIPVVFHLSTWKIPKQSLKEWLIAELSSKYDFKEVITVPWIESHQLLLLLDGLDEVCADWQEDCINNINKFSQDYGQTQMVVCSRLDDYEKLSGRLRCDTALVIQPLNSEQIDRYFQDLQEVAGANVRAIRSAVQNDQVMAELAKTPLFLWIMSLIYKGNAAAELPQEQSAEEAIKQHLFSQYLDRMAEPPDRGQRYPHPQTNINKKRSKQHEPSRTYSKEETLRWLQFLAKRLNQESNSIFLIEQLNPNWLPSNVSPWLYRLGVGLTAGLIMEWVYGLPLGLVGGVLSYQMLSGLLAGLSLGTLTSMNSDIKLFDSLGWSWSWTRAFNAAKPALLSIPVISIITVLMYMVSIIDMGFFWIVGLGLITGVVSAIISGCLAGLVATQPKNKDSIVLTPNRGIWKSAQKSVAASLFALIVVILPTTFLSNYFLPLSVLLGCIGLYAGGLACLQHLTIRTLFWQTNNAPWDYIHFLNYTKKRLLMKQVGGSYLFIHDLLCQNLTSEKDWIKPKLSWQSFSKRIIVGIIIGIIGLNSILLPIAINSWRVGDETAQLFFPRLQLGDRVLTDRLSPRIGKLNQRDIITFKATPEMPENLRNTRMKGEVIGCSGDTLIVRKGKTLIQGKPISDKYLNAYQKYQRSLNSSFDAVPDSNYLVATKYTKQDNFIVAKIPIINIEERAIIKIWPNFTLFIF